MFQLNLLQLIIKALLTFFLTFCVDHFAVLMLGLRKYRINSLRLIVNLYANLRCNWTKYTTFRNKQSHVREVETVDEQLF